MGLAGPRNCGAGGGRDRCALRDVDGHPSRLRMGAGRPRGVRCASDEECKAWLKPAGRMSITSLWRRGGELA